MLDENEDENQAPVGADMTTIAAITNAEIDRQIATARAFPRSIKKFQQTVMEMACLNEKVADECIYALPRKENGQTKMIEGPSARFAEIVASAWGNCRAGARIISEEADFIVAQGAFHDLERNVAISFEVRRSIRGKFGRFKPDMISVTGNAAASIALRNAVFKGVPKAYWSPAWEEARKVTMGNSKTLETRRLACMQDLAKMGAKEPNVFAMLQVKGLQDVTLEHMVMLRGIVTAIRDGDTTVEQAFPDPVTVEKTTTMKDAPPATRVDQGNGLQAAAAKGGEIVDEDPMGVEEPAPARRTRRSDAKKEDALAPAKTEAAPAKNANDDKTSNIMIDEQTSTLMPWQDGAVANVGDLQYQGPNLEIRQFDGQAWKTFADQETAYEAVHVGLQRRVTQHSKRARLDKKQAFEWAQETLKLKTTPTKFSELTMSQLVDLVRSIDNPKD